MSEEHGGGGEEAGGGVVASLLARLNYEVDDHALEGLHHNIERIKHVTELLLGVKIIEGITHLSERYAGLGESLESAAIMTGLTTSNLQKLQYAASQNAISSEEMVMGLTRLNRQLFQAQKGSKQAQSVFASLGITPDQLAGFSNVEEAFYAVEDGINALGSQQQKVATIMQLFGRGGAKYLKLISEGSAGTRELGKRAVEVGAIIDKTSIENLAKFEDSMSSLRLISRNFLANFAGAFIPGITRGIRAVEEFFGKNKKLIVDGIAYIADRFGFYTYVAYRIFRVFSEVVRRSLYGGEGIGGTIHGFLSTLKDTVLDNIRVIAAALKDASSNGNLATLFDSAKEMLASLKDAGGAAVDAITSLFSALSGDATLNLDKSQQRLTTILAILDTMLKLITMAGQGWQALFSGEIGARAAEAFEAIGEADAITRRDQVRANKASAQNFSANSAAGFRNFLGGLTGGLSAAGAMAGPGGASTVLATPAGSSAPPVVLNSTVQVTAAPGMSEQQLADKMQASQQKAVREMARDFATGWLW